ncbi:PetM family cytochrome b6-f complex subunit 7 [Gloeomargaritales cyanobacterium VI4D9]|nr:PetM family cytochrome b6-f complex subunit 7 [Gloeomargaritales cyanobacterium VI4D9]
MAAEIFSHAGVIFGMVLVGIATGFVLIKLTGESSAGRLFKITGKEE